MLVVSCTPYHKNKQTTIVSRIMQEQLLYFTIHLTAKCMIYHCMYFFLAKKRLAQDRLVFNCNPCAIRHNLYVLLKLNLVFGYRYRHPNTLCSFKHDMIGSYLNGLNSASNHAYDEPIL